MDATHPYNQILLAFWRQRDAQGVWTRRVLALWVLTMAVLAFVLSPGLRLPVIVGSTVLLLSSQWLALAGSLLVQNHPHAARFVPDHTHRLRVAAVAAWGGASLLCAALLWGFLPRMPSFAAVLLMMAATLVFAAWAMRKWQLWLVLSFGAALFFGFGLEKRLSPLWEALGALWQMQPESLSALCLLALGWAVTRLFGDGDAAHQAGYASRACMRRMSQEGMTGSRSGLAAFGRPGAWLSRPFERAAAAWLHHTLSCAQATPASVLQRAEIVLHGPQHWVRQVLALLVGLLVAVLSFGVAFVITGSEMQKAWVHGAFGMAIGLSSMGFNPGFSLPNMLWHSRREQALLRLLPGLPQGPALNRAVATLQLRHALLAWFLTTAALGLLAWAAGDPGLTCLALAALPLSVGWLMRVPSRMTAPASWSAVLPIVLFMALGWGMYALHKTLDVPLAAMAGASVGITAALGLWRWRALVAAPAALPAGRLA